MFLALLFSLPFSLPPSFPCLLGLHCGLHLLVLLRGHPGKENTISLNWTVQFKQLSLLVQVWWSRKVHLLLVSEITLSVLLWYSIPSSLILTLPLPKPILLFLFIAYATSFIHQLFFWVSDKIMVTPYMAPSVAGTILKVLKYINSFDSDNTLSNGYSYFP